ncbi:sialate O-acetylesterase [Luteolibacter arcticus]|uniref:Sialate O-acetylesterase n=1 Tax=Luteolibacter arcticus TaxID=1581411 RepID=A0ABT3GJG1_9BACT|nr:sialate O-acetylesterase [Luteolibacter arcticus]MCW1923659.1 sialate O-acetylesterase [Luteolibacter arcticus]
MWTRFEKYRIGRRIDGALIPKPAREGHPALKNQTSMNLVLRPTKASLRISLALLLAAPLGAFAAPLGFSPLFSPGMVLQRDAGIVVTGLGPENGSVTVSLGKLLQPAKVSPDGTWRVELAAQPAGGPHALEVSDGSTTAKIDDLLFGDVWVCSGQSNMQMGLDEALGGTAMIANAGADQRLRLLMMPKAGADKPQADPGAKWSHATPESLRKFSAVAASFALHLRDDPKLKDVPLGIIDSSFGGTAIEAWTPEGTLPAIPEKEISGSMFGIGPGHLFHRMIAPLTATPIKGALWYQGEANAGRPGVYASLLANLAEQWRKQWKQPELPFFVVQLPAYSGNGGGLDYGWLREAQSKACEASPHNFLAVTHDTTDGFDLHPVEKEEIGRRLSLLARKAVYGSDIVANGPRVKDVKAEVDRMVVVFDGPVKSSDGKELRGFAIAGEDGDYRFATATVDGNRVALTSPGVPAPKTVRFAWGGLPQANVVNEAGLPAAPFRTDTLEPRSLDFQPLPVTYRLAGPGYQIETGELGHISSLVAGGKQFLSAEPGGGTSIPGGFGPRSLPAVRMTAPNRIECRDREACLEIACKDDSMEWTITNTGGGEFEFHIALSDKVVVTGTAPTVDLSRGNAKLRVEGIDRVEPGKLVAKVPGRQTCRLKLTVVSK